MGLTNSSIGIKAVDSGLVIRKQSEEDKVIALAGNPNVGKSTVFNGLTGMNQHTGNWPGKTVTNAQGYCDTKSHSYVMVDIPGTYSLMAHSAEEEVARNFICFGGPDAVVVVCDATCLERNLNLVLQTAEMFNNVIVCINMMDEAKRKQIHIDLNLLSERLRVPVVGIVAQKKKSLNNLTDVLDEVSDGLKVIEPLKISYPEVLENAISIIDGYVSDKVGGRLNSRWLSLKLLDCDESLKREIDGYMGEDFLKDEGLQSAVERAGKMLLEAGIDKDKLKDMVVSSLVFTAEDICNGVVSYNTNEYNRTDRRIDKFLTSRLTGYPIMVCMLVIIFWLTIVGANYPSGLLSDLLFGLQDKLSALFHAVGAPEWVHGVFVLGIYRVVAWVVSVMLPPMAIFFPLFTLLEDVGYLPRVAYNLDKPFKCCKACGKQALTMCMGFGCNAAGIVGCRIIDSPRERLLAILTNSFVPCNGRFPTLIAILTMFFVGTSTGIVSSITSALLLTGVILIGVLMTFAVTALLSKTILKGVPSFFTLELPPYRKPQIGKVIVRSIFDRTLFVLGRAVSVAAPAGLIIWVMANVKIGNVSILNACADFLDPFARLMGLDGVILIAFILGFPANEIVVPIIIMAYMSQGTLTEMENLESMKALFVDNGWTITTAVCMMLFSLMHWPCSTTLLTVKKETGSLKWTAMAAVIPTAIGVLMCIFTASIMRLFV